MRRLPLLVCFATLSVLHGCTNTPISGDAGIPPNDGAPSSLDASRDAGPDGGPPAPTCTTGLWDPTANTVTRWPEPALLVDDATTRTGKRIRFDPARYPELIRSAAGFAPVLTEDLADLDGFGVNSAEFFRFEGRPFDKTLLPNGDPTGQPSTSLGIVILGATPRLEPVLVKTTDTDHTLIFTPMHPLPPATRAAVFVTHRLDPAARGCLEPSASMRALLAQPDADTTAALTALTTVGVITGPSDVVALTTFLTESTTDDAVQVAADVATRSFALDAPPTCVNETRWIRCEGTFTAGDYRDADGIFRRRATATPTRTYRVPVTIWLPPTGTAPFPTLVFGHGLGSGRDQAAQLASFAAPQGLATVAIDAVQHGEHPSVPPGSDTATLATVLRFFTIADGSDTRSIFALQMRENFRQSAWDKLQLARLLERSPDVTGDGMPDLDGTKLFYLGVSLGGIMGADLLSLTDAFKAAVLVVPGGRVASIIGDSTQFRPLIDAVRPRGVTAGDVDRFFPTLQTVLDRGDAASYGAHILRNRLAPSSTYTPSVLVGIVLDDDTVPNTCNYAIIRAMGLDVVPPLLRPEPGVGTTAMPPIANNFATNVTAGVLQFDVVRRSDGMIQTATHSNVGASEVGAQAWLHFLKSYLDAGRAEIEDPYARLGIPHRM